MYNSMNSIKAKKHYNNLNVPKFTVIYRRNYVVAINSYYNTSSQEPQILTSVTIIIDFCVIICKTLLLFKTTRQIRTRLFAQLSEVSGEGSYLPENVILINP